MKVTSEQACKAQDTLDSRGHCLPLQDIHEALQTALADVPDADKWMSIAYSADVEGMRYEARANAAEARVAELEGDLALTQEKVTAWAIRSTAAEAVVDELEAKLKKVRAWLEAHRPLMEWDDAMDRLKSHLDGE